MESTDVDAAVRVQVPGKVNLALAVSPRRPDGFHELTTLFMAVSLHDVVTATPARRGRLSVEVSGEGAHLVPVDMTNLAVKAAALLRARYGSPDHGAHLLIEKRIPVAGGMAGGSADAAAALLACSVLWGLEVAQADLHELAAELGSDVPFALMGGCALGTGRGEQLAPTLCKGTYEWVFALAHRGLSTARVFADYDTYNEAQTTPRPVIDRLMTGLASHDLEAVRTGMCNDLEHSAIRLHPPILDTLEEGLGLGGITAIVSGSGPTVAFLCQDEEDAVNLVVGLSTLPSVRAVVRAKGPVPGARVLSNS
ncbi:MAG TPA: 4-(cytidine 5'-diphospho)-2-C-methyl-D-erythritol kinase [Propionibacteriaceae bacterium]|nr:4-(cytidine 5'-diphospho)-2-C-methyl-D-erythritol kinase [Propionibacteriaceae bacterium]